jgi:hypothetical protein
MEHNSFPFLPQLLLLLLLLCITSHTCMPCHTFVRRAAEAKRRDASMQQQRTSMLLHSQPLHQMANGRTDRQTATRGASQSPIAIRTLTSDMAIKKKLK